MKKNEKLELKLLDTTITVDDYHGTLNTLKSFNTNGFTLNLKFHVETPDDIKKIADFFSNIQEREDNANEQFTKHIFGANLDVLFQNPIITKRG